MVSMTVSSIKYKNAVGQKVFLAKKRSPDNVALAKIRVKVMEDKVGFLLSSEKEAAIGCKSAENTLVSAMMMPIS